MRTLHAWIDNRKVGAFTESPRADGSTLYAFEYEEVTSKNIVSLTMVPIEGELRFESPPFPPPFYMVLPEGERDRQTLRRLPGPCIQKGRNVYWFLRNGRPLQNRN